MIMEGLFINGFYTPLLDEMEHGSWPSFVKDPEEHDQQEAGQEDAGE